jgi:hypothetical protein
LQSALSQAEKNPFNVTLLTRVARFFLTQYTKMGKRYQSASKLPNGRNTYIQNSQIIYQPFPFTQIGIFGLKTNDLATLLYSISCFHNRMLLISNGF